MKMQNNQKKREDPGQHTPQQRIFTPGNCQLEPDGGWKTENQQQENHFAHSLPHFYLD